MGDPLTAPEQGIISAVAFSADGRYVASGDGFSRNVQLRQANDGRPIGQPLQGHTAAILRIGFGKEDSSILSAGLDGWMQWPGPSGWDDALCAKLTSNMTQPEWDEWVSPEIDDIPACPTLPGASHHR